MKSIKKEVDGVAYDISYAVTRMGNDLEFNVIVKNGATFDFRVSNYHLSTKILQVSKDDNSWLSFDIAKEVFSDYEAK